ncbi:putative 3,9-dihydroxypterocarpan 6A-monooxygenase [Cocos nucifera]|uniref:Putative 3,9-dihydroxypterocarpan 6A-monooxygenase n=1 Tax=Cocos nucifera TaxID=13894 RepID=A0A8K0N5G0_COCNU|nr:putative 3,9-dihydroxypterocarpan 6A-monooxygenase [Cocos nucifera]
MHFYFDSVPVIVASFVNMAKLILKTHDVTFCGQPKTTANRACSILKELSAILHMQSITLSKELIITLQALNHFYYLLLSNFSYIFGSSGRPVSLKDHLSNVSLNVISRMVLGKRYLDESEDEMVPPEEFKAMLDELFSLNGVMNIGDSIPWLDFLDLQGYIGRMKKVGKKFDRFLEHVVDEHNERWRREGEKFVAKDMVDVLLQLADDPTLEVKLERRGVKAFTQDLIAGGTESSAVTLEWAISELLKRPEICKTAELDWVIGRHRWVEEKELHHLPYIEAIIKEAMRMHPVAPMLVPRQCREDCDVAGYDIPAGTRLLVNVWTIGRDPTI